MPSPQSDHARRLLSSLNQQRSAGSFCDAALKMADGVVHHVHRCVLSCFSDLFQQPITAASPRLEFCLPGCTSDGLLSLLDFIYTGELQLDPINLETVREAAASLQVPEALALCVRFQEVSEEAAPLRRKRGRPRKSVVDLVKKENLSTVTKEEVGFDGCGSTTTTRCGRVVKGPKRLVSIDDNQRTTSQQGVEDTSMDPPTGKTQQAPLVQVVTSDGVGGGEPEEEEEEEEEEEDGDDGDLEDVSDAEYVLPADPPPSEDANEDKITNKTFEIKNNKKEEKEEEEEEEEIKEDGSVTCPTCSKSFKSKYYLKVHNRRHTGERPFGCTKCGKKYFRKENLLMHEIRDCSQVQTYSCPTCSSSFQSKEELRLHVISHTGEMPHKCSTCQEQFLYKKNLSSHMMKIHGHPKPHACSQCPKTFLTRTELRVHEAAKHRGEKPFVCEECGHRASSRNGLQMHIRAIHRNERPFVCTFCGHAFSQKNNLNMHLRIHSGERPYQCHLCGKTFRTQASLDKHQRTHTGERPFSCDVCEQRFTEKGALVRHKASKHEEGRPHGCQICSKTFKAKEQLRVHLRRHKGMRKFECSDCGYKFTRQAHLRRHSQIHKRNENYNPRQRKLRNLIVQEIDGSQQEVTDGTDLHPVFTPASPGPSSDTAPTCIVRVVIGEAVMEQVGSNQRLEQVEVLQQAELDSEVFQSTIDMDAIAEDLTLVEDNDI